MIRAFLKTATLSAEEIRIKFQDQQKLQWDSKIRIEYVWGDLQLLFEQLCLHREDLHHRHRDTVWWLLEMSFRHRKQYQLDHFFSRHRRSAANALMSWTKNRTSSQCVDFTCISWDPPNTYSHSNVILGRREMNAAVNPLCLDLLK